MPNTVLNPELKLEYYASNALIGMRVRAWRHDKNLTLFELAKECQLSVSYISKLERGQINPTVQVAKRIAEYFNKKNRRFSQVVVIKGQMGHGQYDSIWRGGLLRKR